MNPVASKNSPAAQSFFAGFWLLISIVLAPPSAYGVVDIHEFDNEVLRLRYYSLIEELRCPKCQNQNLADSDSPVAADLRREVQFLLKDGRSDTEIRQFMRERYGDFILYDPPFEGKTLLVWLLPALLAVLAVIAAVIILRRAAQAGQFEPAVNTAGVESDAGSQALESDTEGEER